MNLNKQALKESVADTVLAATINVPINYVMVSIAFAMNYNALQTTLFITGVLTVIAITRKYFVRVQFSKGEMYAKKKESRVRSEEEENFNSRTKVG